MSEYLCCNRCGDSIRRGRGEHFEVGIVAVCDPNDPVIDEADVVNPTAEIKRLLEQLESAPVIDAQRSVHRRAVMALCQGCIDDWFDEVTTIGH